MDNSVNPQNPPNDNDHLAEVPANPQSKPPQLENCVGSLSSAIRRGAHDAKAAAEKFIPKVKSAAAGAAYWAGYGISFAAVFQWNLARNTAPESLKAGCRDGLKAGSDTADRWTEKMRQRKEQATNATPDETGPSADVAQAGAA